jgi:hypothetical protein
VPLYLRWPFTHKHGWPAPVIVVRCMYSPLLMLALPQIITTLLHQSHGPKTLSSPGKYLLKKASGGGDGKIYSSVAQVRGVPHPMVCAFVPDSVADSTTPTLAVAGMDELGNGVLLLSELASDGGEPKRVGYHRFFKKSGSAALAAAAQKSKKKPHQHSSASPQELYVQDTATYIAHGFDNIIVREEEDEIGFVSVEKTDTKSAVPSTAPSSKESSPTKSDDAGNFSGEAISAE